MNNPLVCLDDYEEYAISVLPKKNLDFYKSGAGSETTLIENRQAFGRYKIRPRFLRDVSRIDISTKVLGERISMPIGISPTSLQKMAHPDGELANARAAQSLETIFTLSTASSYNIEDVAIAAPTCIKWFQLYIFKNRKITESLISRAEKAGYKALVVTIDLPVIGIRRADLRNKFSMPTHITYANFMQVIEGLRKENPSIEVSEFVKTVHDSSLQWSDIEWLKTTTKLPIILKGILTKEDALLAAESHADGIIVSNHGGRQLDGCLASIDALEEIVQAVGAKMEIYLDGGVREGTDVFKALALGAKMVFVGRPALWGLTNDGENGVKNILNILKHELSTTMALSGCFKLEDIQRDMVIPSYGCSKL